jgi:DHA1 family bicyclomycin/chloramphenicol resistance-like MFS transporter
MLTLMQQITMIAPLLAPLLGGWLLLLAGWRSLFLLLAVMGAICWPGGVAVAGKPSAQPPQRHHAGQGLPCLRPPAATPAHHGLQPGAGPQLWAMFAYITGSPFVYIQYFGVAASITAICSG